MVGSHASRRGGRRAGGWPGSPWRWGSPTWATTLRPSSSPRRCTALWLARRFAAAALSRRPSSLQPSAAWTAFLARVLRQPLENSNSGIYHAVLLPFLHPPAAALWREAARGAPAVCGDIFFAANFLFLRALFLFAVVINPVTSRIRLGVAEAALLLSALALFLFLNCEPGTYGGWAMNGTWISRPLPAGVPGPAPLLRPLARTCRPSARPLPQVWSPPLLAGTGAWGTPSSSSGPSSGTRWGSRRRPSTGSTTTPTRISSMSPTWRRSGGGPSGLRGPRAAPPTGDELRAAELSRLHGMRDAFESVRSALLQNKRAYRDTARALALSQSDLYARPCLELRRRPRRDHYRRRGEGACTGRGRISSPRRCARS